MNTLKQPDLNSQRGAATLLTALVILIGITLVTLTTSKTVLVETQMAADNYRTSQAVAAANYAMDLGVNYFDNGGFDQKINATAVAGNDSIVDTVAVPNLVSADGSQTTTALLRFNDEDNDGNTTEANRCSTSPSMKSGLITATGFSDDGLATRTITQCVGPLELLRDDGPDQPLVAQGQVAVTGNAHIINRYTNTTVWAGDKVKIGSSSSMETLIKDPAVLVPLTQAQLLDTDASNNTQLVSNKNLGNGLDIIDGDPNLNTLVGLDFFKNFFSVDSREQMKQMAIAAGQYYTNISSAAGKSGLIWIEGDQHLTGGTFGSTTSPAIIIVNGDLDSSGNSTINGLLYMAGKYDIGGTVTVVGSNIVEGTNLVAVPETPATAPAVSGTGTLNLVYWRAFASASSNPLPGLTTVISGSWRDW
jgi:hypothetical protein